MNIDATKRRAGSGRSLLLLGLLLSLPCGSALADDLVPYGAAGWRYLIVGHGDPVTLVFMDPQFDHSAWSTGAAPFGSPGCPSSATVQTNWTVGTDVLLRRDFVADPNTPVSIQFGIDNDVNIWINGTLITSVVHENCANLDDFSVGVPAGIVTSGINVLAIQAIDRGGVSFFDVHVQGIFPTPTGRVSWGGLKLLYR